MNRVNDAERGVVVCFVLLISAWRSASGLFPDTRLLLQELLEDLEEKKNLTLGRPGEHGAVISGRSPKGGPTMTHSGSALFLR